MFKTGFDIYVILRTVVDQKQFCTVATFQLHRSMKALMNGVILFDARLSDPVRALEALARTRALYVLEADANAQNITGPALHAHWQHAAPILSPFAD